MEQPGRVFIREQLLDGVWGRDIYIDERTVDVHVGRLRKALNRGRRAGSDPHRARRRLRAGRPVREGGGIMTPSSSRPSAARAGTIAADLNWHQLEHQPGIATNSCGYGSPRARGRQL